MLYLIFFLFQARVVQFRKKNGISPFLPPVDEREAVKRQHAAWLGR